MVSLSVDAASAGERLDRFLARTAGLPDSPLAGLSRSRLQALIDAGHVRVGGRPAKRAQKLRDGEVVEVEVPAPTPVKLEPEPIPLSVLYEDPDIIVIDKPAGLAVHPGAGRTSGTLVNALLAHCRDLSGIGGELRPGIIHRLDRGTSGVLVVAKHDRAHIALARQFAAREVDKRYDAFVLGTPTPARATIDTLYGRHPTLRQRFTSRVKAGKRAVTSYDTVFSSCGISRLAVVLGTGRTHQIRVHLAERGHPVVGDPLYGGKQFSRITDVELRLIAGAISHQALHAASLSFSHPTTGARLSFAATLPDDLARLWGAMQPAGLDA